MKAADSSKLPRTVLPVIAGLLICICLVVLLAIWKRSPEATNWSEEQYRQTAVNEIQRRQAILKIDASKLPPLVSRQTEDGFDYAVDDESQNISIFVHVSREGVAEIGWATLDRARQLEDDARRRFKSSPPRE